jgi:hypothetical protein
MDSINQPPAFRVAGLWRTPWHELEKIADFRSQIADLRSTKPFVVFQSAICNLQSSDPGACATKEMGRFFSKESVMRMKARRNLVPAMAAMAGLCWGMTARAQEGPAITTNPLTVRGQYPGNQEPATSRFRPYGTMKTGQPDLSSNFTPKGFVNPTAMPGGDDDLTNVQETTPGLPRVVPALMKIEILSIPIL